MIFYKVTRLPLKYFDNHQYGDILSELLMIVIPLMDLAETV